MKGKLHEHRPFCCLGTSEFEALPSLWGFRISHPEPCTLNPEPFSRKPESEAPRAKWKSFRAGSGEPVSTGIGWTAGAYMLIKIQVEVFLRYPLPEIYKESRTIVLVVR